MDAIARIKIQGKTRMVISEEIRTVLYPLGIISTFAFTLRFLFQWIQSEKAGKSIVTAPFWWLSLLGNISLGVHAFIQGQFPVCLVQSVNVFIASRNLNLMEQSQNQWSLSTVFAGIASSLFLPIVAFYFFSPEAWFRIPIHMWQGEAISLTLFWHILGAIGVVLFASRFWVQWLQSERAHKSTLELPFWWLSLIGAFFSIIYFAAIRDYINLVGPLFGMIPYFRNLILIRQNEPN